MIWSTEPSDRGTFYKKVFVRRAVDVWEAIRTFGIEHSHLPP